MAVYYVLPLLTAAAVRNTEMTCLTEMCSNVRKKCNCSHLQFDVSKDAFAYLFTHLTIAVMLYRDAPLCFSY